MPLEGIVERLVRFGILPEQVATVVWSDLTESAMGEKVEVWQKIDEYEANTAENWMEVTLKDGKVW